jgi:hypothetical protein
VENYYFDKGSDLSPIELVLGWQDMSKDSFLEKIEINQSRRFYYFFSKNIPMAIAKRIPLMSANVHIIPANEKIKTELKKFSLHDLIHLKGYLVKVESQSGDWIWKSSLSRKDKGDGSCEIFYVDSIEKVK